jgi:hypothetical protein
LIENDASGDQVAAGGFFFALGFATFGGATGSGPRSTEVRRPAVNVYIPARCPCE